jgi:hypothetical protein
MKKLIYTLLTTTFFITYSIGQQGLKPDSLTLNAIQKINFLTGKWKGEGWIQMGKDKHYFVQNETVTQKVNNAVLVIDGLGTDKETNKIIHQAFAIISYDLTNKKYLMRAFRADGNYIDAADAVVDENGSYVWGFTHPQAGKIRYTIKLIDSKWVEKGEISRDGNTWNQFLEMTLSKEL